MAQWGNTDDAANSVLWAVSQLKQGANAANRDALFGNTTANAYFAGTTIGQYGVDPAETTAARAEAAGDRPAHAGWVLRTVGQGGRAGRTQTEVLVAMSSIKTDAEDVVYQDAFITISTQPSPASANASADETATFIVAADVAPIGTALTYSWTYANGDSIAVGETSNTTTTTLTINANTAVDATQYKVTVGATGADSVVSTNVAITVTT
jgi:hypothetical protein